VQDLQDGEDLLQPSSLSQPCKPEARQETWPAKLQNREMTFVGPIWRHLRADTFKQQLQE
jgi:hypothetical protein